MSYVDCWTLASKVLGASRRTLFYGPPGTGKTRAAFDWARNNGWLHYSITLTPETQKTEILGSFIIQEGEMAWMDAVGSAAWRASHQGDVKGVVLVLNEIDHSVGSDVATMLHGFLDDEEMAQVTLPTRETLAPAKGKVKWVATMNGDPLDLPEALRDRFPSAIYIDTPHPEAVKLLSKDIRGVAVNSFKSKDAKRRISMRQLSEFDMLRKSIGDEFAAQAILGGRAQEFVDSIKVAASAKP